jgi:hypothetical protein
MTTQPEPTPQTPDAATDALPPPWQRLLALSGVAFTPLVVIGWLTKRWQYAPLHRRRPRVDELGA